ncbi:hypothetical protein, partial [Xanthomonas sacchari]|uniref:hypothetical protein n=1 Tax=Xanthomonas sacchari TaxID=56458 RepID=UPI00225E1582
AHALLPLLRRIGGQCSGRLGGIGQNGLGAANEVASLAGRRFRTGTAVAATMPGTPVPHIDLNQGRTRRRGGRSPPISRHSATQMHIFHEVAQP